MVTPGNTNDLPHLVVRGILRIRAAGFREVETSLRNPLGVANQIHLGGAGALEYGVDKRSDLFLRFQHGGGAENTRGAAGETGGVMAIVLGEYGVACVVEGRGDHAEGVVHVEPRAVNQHHGHTAVKGLIPLVHSLGECIRLVQGTEKCREKQLRIGVHFHGCRA